MKVIILSGGLGYRLKEETEFKPKPMVNIGNKPILWHIMKIYAYYGFNEFILALGYRGEYIKEYFLNQKHFINDFTLHTQSGRTVIHKNSKNGGDDFKITFVDTGLKTLPGERILLLKNYIPEKDKEFMVTYGDGVADINIKKLLAFHRKQKKIGTLTGVFPRSKYGLLAVGKNNMAESFNEKPELKDRINGGFMVFNKEFFDYLKPEELEHEGLKRLIAKNQLSVYNHDSFWHCMDTYSDVDSLNDLWNTNPQWKVWKG